MRADVFLTAFGHTASRQTAKRLIEGGHVSVDGVVLKKPSAEISEGEHTVTVSDPLQYVGRGGLKLEAALDAFGVLPEGLTALDIGASTGGFTDCLLRRGAERVYAVDSGKGQLAETLKNDPRVISMEGCNARYLTAEQLGERVDLVVMDVSFISATYLIPLFPALLKERGIAICLIKPQFEVGKSRIGKSGIVKDPAAHRFAAMQVIEAGRTAGLHPIGLIPSPVTGGDGNREFLVYFIAGETHSEELTERQIRTVTG